MKITYAIGDVHGCVRELKQALDWIEADEDRRRGSDYRIVMLGDYTDRGPDSMGVISELIRRSDAHPKRYVFLKGNHDAAFLDFLTPLALFDVDGWRLAWGGDKTMESYDPKQWVHQNKLAAHIAERYPRHVMFLKTLRLYYEDESHVYAHAGLAPGIPLEEQTEMILTWTRQHSHHGHPKMLVHGHTPAREPLVEADHVCLDTACAYGGFLSVGVFDEAQREPIHIQRFWRER